MKNVIFFVFLPVIAASIYFFLNFSLFIIQPIGAIPNGVTLIVKRSTQLNFVDSADAICLRTVGGVSLMCRITTLGQVVSEDGIYTRLPYNQWLFRYSMGENR